MKQKAILIPARLESTRLARKLLLDLGGQSVLQSTYARAKQARGFVGVWICTDSPEIADHARSFGAKVIMTSSTVKNGSERIAEALAQLPDIEVVVNLQGDEPFADPELLQALSEEVCAIRTPVITAACAISDQEIPNPNVVKLVCDQNNQALYFSRVPIPYFRNPEFPYLGQKHLGIYAFDRSFLLDYVGWDAGPLESLEMIEILRVMERGFPVRVMDWDCPAGPSIDTEEDYQEALHLLNCCAR